MSRKNDDSSDGPARSADSLDDPLTRVDRLVTRLAEALEDVEDSYRAKEMNWEHYASCSQTLLDLSHRFYDGYL